MGPKDVSSQGVHQVDKNKSQPEIQSAEAISYISYTKRYTLEHVLLPSCMYLCKALHEQAAFKAHYNLQCACNLQFTHWRGASGITQRDSTQSLGLVSG